MSSVKEIEADFKRLIKKEALGHAYVFYGPGAEAQFKLAKELANYLETKKWQEPTGVLLDAKFFDGREQNLGVDIAREFSSFLYRQPVVSTHRTLVVGGAGELTAQAQNAILKLVEEPPSHGVVILTVKDTNSFLPALRSRVQTFYVATEAGQSGKDAPATVQAREMVDKFLMSQSDARKKMIKQMIEADREEEVEKSEKIIDTFVSCLIEELAKMPEKNMPALKELLKRQTAMGDYSTNKKLQLEAALQFIQ